MASSNRRGPDGLTDLERRFIVEYLSNGHNGTQAYIDSCDGTPNRNTAEKKACEILARPPVAERIAKAIDAAARKIDITAERVLAEIATVAFARMGEFARVTEHGALVLDVSKADPSLTAVSEITQDEYWEGKGDDAERIKRTKFKLHSKLDALDKLARHLGLFKDKLELTGKDGAPIETVNTQMTVKEAADAYAATLNAEG